MGKIKAESSNTNVFGSLTLYVLMDYLIHIDKIKMELFIVCQYNMRSQVTSSKFLCMFYVLKDYCYLNK